jgi:hypothetical protein
VRRLRPVVTAGAVAALLVLGACGGEDAAEGPAAASPSSSAGASEPSSEAADPTDPPDPTEATEAPRTGTQPSGNCLFTVAEVSTVLGGTWTREPSPDGPCAYRSDRGAVFGTQRVRPVEGQTTERGLLAARQSCVPGVEPVTLPGDRSVCVEDHGGTDYVVGNLIVARRLWVVVIVPASPRPHAAELRAVTAIVGSV